MYYSPVCTSGTSLSTMPPAFAASVQDADVESVGGATSTATACEQDVVSRTLIRNRLTGSVVSVPTALTRAERVAELRRAIKEQDVQVQDEGSIAVDYASQTYQLTRYPPLGFLINLKWFIVFGAFLMAACSQVQFFFPCVGDTAALVWQGNSYCVLQQEASRVTASACPADVCVKRVPVTLQTWAALLNGALAGTTGAWATALYVVMVCLGAPFGSDGRSRAVWQKAALVGPTGGFFVGMTLASYVMGRCAHAGHDRPTSLLRMVPWMFAAEAAIYAFGMAWYPFGVAIARGVSPAAVCPDFLTNEGARKCFSTIAYATFIPFVPGEAVKMAMVWATVPLAWYFLMLAHRYSKGWRPVGGLVAVSSDLASAEEQGQAAQVEAGPAGVQVELVSAGK